MEATCYVGIKWEIKLAIPPHKPFTSTKDFYLDRHVTSPMTILNNE